MSLLTDELVRALSEVIDDKWFMNDVIPHIEEEVINQINTHSGHDVTFVSTGDLLNVGVRGWLLMPMMNIFYVYVIFGYNGDLANVRVFWHNSEVPDPFAHLGYKPMS